MTISELINEAMPQTPEMEMAVMAYIAKIKGQNPFLRNYAVTTDDRTATIAGINQDYIIKLEVIE